MEEVKGLRIKFIKLMEDFCVPFDTTLVDDFNELDFQDGYDVEDFLERLGLKEKNLQDKLTLLRAAAKLVCELEWFAKLDDPDEKEVPFYYLHVGVDQPFAEIEAHYTSITERMRQTLNKSASQMSDAGLERDLALCEKAFQRIKEIRGVD